MRRLRVLLLLAATMAVVGFVVVVVGQHSTSDDATEVGGWFAYAPSEPATASEAYSSALEIDLDDEPGVGAVTVAGFGLVGLSFLLTAGIIGTWAARRPEPTE